MFNYKLRPFLTTKVGKKLCSSTFETFCRRSCKNAVNPTEAELVEATLSLSYTFPDLQVIQAPLNFKRMSRD